MTQTNGWMLYLIVVVGMILGVAFIAVVRDKAVEEDRMEALTTCVNSELHNSPNLTWSHSEAGFQFALKKCSYVYNGGK